MSSELVAIPVFGDCFLFYLFGALFKPVFCFGSKRMGADPARIDKFQALSKTCISGCFGRTTAMFSETAVNIGGYSGIQAATAVPNHVKVPVGHCALIIQGYNRDHEQKSGTDRAASFFSAHNHRREPA